MHKQARANTKHSRKSQRPRRQPRPTPTRNAEPYQNELRTNHKRKVPPPSKEGPLLCGGQHPRRKNDPTFEHEGRSPVLCAWLFSVLSCGWLLLGVGSSPRAGKKGTSNRPKPRHLFCNFGFFGFFGSARIWRTHIFGLIGIFGFLALSWPSFKSTRNLGNHMFTSQVRKHTARATHTSFALLRFDAATE